MAEEKLLNQIRNLLAKAESTTFEAEADACIAKAQELMMKHAIDEAMLKASGKKSREEIVTLQVTIRKRFKATQGSFLHQMAQLFNCRVYYTDIGARLPYTVVGYESDAAFVEILFESIRAQANRDRLAAGIGLRKIVDCNDCGGSGEYPDFLGGGKCETCKGKGKRQGSQGIAAHSFLDGYFNRVLARCRERYKKQVEEAGSSVALALRDRSVDVDDWMKKRVSLRTARASRARSFDAGAHASGRSAGERTDISGGRGHIKPTKELE